MLSVDGLASGLDTSGLIQQLLAIQQRPIFLLQEQVATANQKQTAFLDVTARVLSLQTTVARLADPETFNAVTASSSNESVLAASASTAADETAVTRARRLLTSPRSSRTRAPPSSASLIEDRTTRDGRSHHAHAPIPGVDKPPGHT